MDWTNKVSFLFCFCLCSFFLEIDLYSNSTKEKIFILEIELYSKIKSIGTFNVNVDKLINILIQINYKYNFICRFEEIYTNPLFIHEITSVN